MMEQSAAATGRVNRLLRRGVPRPTPLGVFATLVVAIVLVIVLYPVYFLVRHSLNVGDPQAQPIVDYGLSNYGAILENPEILFNTLYLATIATVSSVALGFCLAWAVGRVDIPGKSLLERLLIVPYYVTPLVGALAWYVLGNEQNGLINRAWRMVGGSGSLIDITSVLGIALVMTLFDGAIAFSMISAAMKSMDPSLEENSRVLGSGVFKTMRRVTFPILLPAVFSAALYVFVSMLGAFAAPLILGTSDRFYVVATQIYRIVLSYPPDYPQAAAMGISVCLVVLIAFLAYWRFTKSRSYVTVSARGFTSRQVAIGKAGRSVIFGLVLAYLSVAVILPILTLLYTSFRSFLGTNFAASGWALDHWQTVFGLGPIRGALTNTLILAVAVGVAGSLMMGLLAWLIYRTSLSPIVARPLEIVAMFPIAIPRIVLALGLLWAWLAIPLPVYGTLWLLWIAYMTVFLPLGLRTFGSVILQLDKTLEEAARVCGAGRLRQLRTVTVPLLRPGFIAAGILLFAASSREVGASILLMSADSKVFAPSIVTAFGTTSAGLTAAMAITQTVVVFAAIFVLAFSIGSGRTAIRG